MSSSTVSSGVKKIVALLGKKERRIWFFMIALALLVSSLEIVTATIVMVFAQILNDPTFGFHYLSKIGIHSISSNQMILYMSVLVGITFVIKNSIALLEAFFQNFSVQKMNYHFQQRMLRHYSDMDYRFYLTRNSSEWHYVIAHEIETMFSSGLAPFSLFVSESCIFVCLVILMIVVNPSLAGIIFGFGAVVYISIKKGLLPLFYQWGKQQQTVSQQLNQHLYQFFHAFKEMILLGKKDFLMKCYADNAEKKSHINALKTATAVIPRLIMETLFVILFVVAVSYLCFKNESPTEIMGVLGGYLYIGFRLMPGLNRMIAQISLFKSSIPSINRVFEEYHRETPTVSSVDLPTFTFDHNLLLSHICFSYSSSHQTLNNIFLEIKKGECLGIVGETGSGKSTLVDIVLGLLQPSEGKILVDNQYVVNSKQWHEMLAYVPQVIYLTDDTIEANIAFGENKESINYGRLQKAIEDAQLRPLIERLPEGVKTLVGERGIRLSGGEKQRIAIARALYRDAQVFIFDEATSALDNETEVKLMEVLQSLQKDRTFIIVAHRLTTLQGCDRIVMLKAGKIEKIVSYQELGLVSKNV